jgi:[CysO sulfur-carrier protein]-S-L-cysteine hydrolase
VVSLDDLRISPDLAGDGAGVLRLPRVVLAEMLAHIEAGYPNEACGVLAGSDGRVVKHYPTANASDTPRTFSEIAPRELLAIWNEIDSNDWQALAYYHSHPATPAYPSPRDVQWSQGWPGTYYIIFSLADRAHPIVRAFLIAGETISEHRIVAEDNEN